VTAAAAAVTIDLSRIPLGKAVRGYATDAYEGYTLLLGASGGGDQYERAARSVYRRRGRGTPFSAIVYVYNINVYAYTNTIYRYLYEVNLK